MSDPRHFRTCNICEAMCGIEISVQAHGTLRIEGDAEDVFSRGYICPKAVALQDPLRPGSAQTTGAAGG